MLVYKMYLQKWLEVKQKSDMYYKTSLKIAL